MSRGAGWALRLGLTRWDLFGTIGLHSLAVLQKDASRITNWLADIPPSSRPRVFMDIGDNDPELDMAQLRWKRSSMILAYLMNGIFTAVRIRRNTGAPMWRNIFNGMQMDGIIQ